MWNTGTEYPQTVREVRAILSRPGVRVMVTSVILNGGGVSFRVSKTDVLNELKGKGANDSPSYGGAEIYFDEADNTLYI